MAGLVAGLLLVSACQQAPESTAAPTGVVAPGQTAVAPEVLPSTAPPPTAAATDTPAPTPTPTAPLAATVNGQPIYLADYEQELARYESAQSQLGVDLATIPNYRDQVLNSLIERELIRQAAVAAGISISDELLDSRLAELRTAAGDAANFSAWLQTNGYTEEGFREALRLELLTAEMVTRVTADVPTTGEQVRARYIQLDDPAVAEDVHQRAAAGDDFAFLAQQYSVDRVTGELGGDLGFFSPGALLVPDVETAAFALQPGEISPVIAVPNTDGTSRYYIVQTTERDPNRELTAESRYRLLNESFSKWLAGVVATATVEHALPQP